MNIRKCMTLLVILFLTAPFVSAQRSSKLKAAASIFPVYNLAEEIAGDQADLFFCVPAGANPHLYEPAPTVVRKLQKVELFIAVDDHFDGWVKRFLPPKAKILWLNGDEFEGNPHSWLSAVNAKTLAERIAAELAELRPDSRPVFGKNLAGLEKRFDDLNKEIAELFKPLKGSRFFLWHPSWNYFARDYGLEVAGVLESGHGDEPSVQDMQRLVGTAKEKNVRVVVVDLNVESRSAGALQREIGGELLRLDAVGDPDKPDRNSLISLLRWNARKLAAALEETGKK